MKNILWTLKFLTKIILVIVGFFMIIIMPNIIFPANKTSHLKFKLDINSNAKQYTYWHHDNWYFAEFGPNDKNIIHPPRHLNVDQAVATHIAINVAYLLNKGKTNFYYEFDVKIGSKKFKLLLMKRQDHINEKILSLGLLKHFQSDKLILHNTQSMLYMIKPKS